MSATLVPTGILLIIGAAGGLGERAPGWIVPAADIAWVALFLWIALASVTARDTSALGQTMFWLGVAPNVALLLGLLGSMLVFYRFPDFVVTNAAILPILLLELPIWLCPVAWFVCFALRLWTGGRGQAAADPALKRSRYPRR